jgi:hypothetical protein
MSWTVSAAPNINRSPPEEAMTLYTDVRPPAWRLKVMAEAGTLPAGWTVPTDAQAVTTTALSLPAAPAVAAALTAERARVAGLNKIASEHGVSDEALIDAIASGRFPP